MPGIDIKPDAQGKVRDLYDLGDKLLLVASDRISAFDGKTRDKQDFWKRLIWNPVKIWRSTEKD